MDGSILLFKKIKKEIQMKTHIKAVVISKVNMQKHFQRVWRISQFI